MANLVTQPENLSAWPVYNLAPTITSNIILAPDGTLTADRMQNPGGGAAGIQSPESYLMQPGETYQFSYFIKTVSRTSMHINHGAGIFQTNTNYNLDLSQPVMGQMDGMDSAVASWRINEGNGWTRVVVQFTHNLLEGLYWRFYGWSGQTYDVYLWGISMEIIPVGQEGVLIPYTAQSTWVSSPDPYVDPSLALENLICVADANHSRVLVRNRTSWNHIKAIGWSGGNHNTQLNFPMDGAINANSVFILDSGDHRLLRLDQQFSYISKIGSINEVSGGTQLGFGNQEFYFPGAIAATASSLFIADSQNNRVLKLDSTNYSLQGMICRVHPWWYPFPYGLSVDPLNTNNMYANISANSQNTMRLETGNWGVASVSNEPYGGIYNASNYSSYAADVCAYNGRVFVLQATGPGGVTLSRIVEVNPTDWSIVQSASATLVSWQYPNGICSDGTYIYNTENTGDVKKRLMTDLSIVASFDYTGVAPNDLFRAEGICANSTHVFVADSGNNRIVKLLKSNMSYVSNSTGTLSLSAPGAVICDDTHIWVYDYGNNRIVQALASDFTSVQQTSQSLGGYTGAGRGYLTQDATNIFVGNPSDTNFFTIQKSNLQITDFTGSGGTDPAFYTNNFAGYVWTLALTPDGTSLYATDTLGRIKEHNASDLSFVRNILPDGQAGNYDWQAVLSVEADAQYLYLGLQDAGGNYVLRKYQANPFTFVAEQNVLPTAPFGAFDNATIDPLTNRLYSWTTNENQVWEYNPTNLAYIQTLLTSGTGNNQVSFPAGVFFQTGVEAPVIATLTATTSFDAVVGQILSGNISMTNLNSLFNLGYEYVPGNYDDIIYNAIYDEVLQWILDDFTPEIVHQYKESILFKSFIESIAQHLAEAKLEIAAAVNGLNIQKAATIFLDLWSSLTGLSKQSVTESDGTVRQESDEEYRSRLVDSIFWDKISNNAIKKSILLKMGTEAIVADSSTAAQYQDVFKNPTFENITQKIVTFPNAMGKDLWIKTLFNGFGDVELVIIFRHTHDTVNQQHLIEVYRYDANDPNAAIQLIDTVPIEAERFDHINMTGLSGALNQESATEIALWLTYRDNNNFIDVGKILYTEANPPTVTSTLGHIAVTAHIDTPQGYDYVAHDGGRKIYYAPHDVVSDNKYYYVADANNYRVVKKNLDGSYVSHLGGPGVRLASETTLPYNPHALALWNNCRLFVADSTGPGGNPVINVYTTSFSWLGSITTSISLLRAISCDENYLYVVGLPSAGTITVYVYNPFSLALVTSFSHATPLTNIWSMYWDKPLSANCKSLLQYTILGDPTKDSSASNKSYSSSSGTTTVTPLNQKFHPMSLLMDGSYYLYHALPDADFNWGSGGSNGAFTIDTWIYPTSLTSIKTVLSLTTDVSNTFTLFTYGSGLVCQINKSSPSVSLRVESAQGIVQLNSWNHIVCTGAFLGSRYYVTLYVNGEYVAENSNSQSPYPTTGYTSRLCIGGNNQSLSQYNFIGQMAETRIDNVTRNNVSSNGPFNPPTEPYPVTGKTGRYTLTGSAGTDGQVIWYDAVAHTPTYTHSVANSVVTAAWQTPIRHQDFNTIFLADFDELYYNDVTKTPEIAMPTGTLSLNLISLNGATLNTTIKKWGVSALNFPGTQTTQCTKTAVNTALNGSAFTIEGWFYYEGKNAGDNHARFFSIQNANASQYTFFQIQDNPGLGRRAVWWNQKDGSTWSLVSAYDNNLIKTATWQHFACVKSGAEWALYIDGTRVSYINTNPPAFSSTYTMYIGCGYDPGPPLYLDRAIGKLDNMRISNVARYTPSTTALFVPIEPYRVQESYTTDYWTSPSSYTVSFLYHYTTPMTASVEIRKRSRHPDFGSYVYKIPASITGYKTLGSDVYKTIETDWFASTGSNSVVASRLASGDLAVTLADEVAFPTPTWNLWYAKQIHAHTDGYLYFMDANFSTLQRVSAADLVSNRLVTNPGFVGDPNPRWGNFTNPNAGIGSSAFAVAGNYVYVVTYGQSGFTTTFTRVTKATLVYDTNYTGQAWVDRPHSACIQGNQMFVTDEDAADSGWGVHVFDITTGSRTATIMNHSGGAPSSTNCKSMCAGVATDGTNIYVVDNGNYRVVKRSATAPYTYVAEVGTQGSGNGQFQNPIGCHTDGTFLYVTDPIRNDIQRFKCSDLSYVDKWGYAQRGWDAQGGFILPFDTAVVNDGTLFGDNYMYVSDTGNARIVKRKAFGYRTEYDMATDCPMTYVANGGSEYLVLRDSSNTFAQFDITDLNDIVVEEILDRSGSFITHTWPDVAAPQYYHVTRASAVYDAYNDAIYYIGGNSGEGVWDGSDRNASSYRWQVLQNASTQGDHTADFISASSTISGQKENSLIRDSLPIPSKETLFGFSGITLKIDANTHRFHMWLGDKNDHPELAGGSQSLNKKIYTYSVDLNNVSDPPLGVNGGTGTWSSSTIPIETGTRARGATWDSNPFLSTPKGRMNSSLCYFEVSPTTDEVYIVGFGTVDGSSQDYALQFTQTANAGSRNVTQVNTRLLSNVVELSLKGFNVSNQQRDEIYKEATTLLALGNIISFVSQDTLFEFLDYDSVFGTILYGSTYMGWPQRLWTAPHGGITGAFQTTPPERVYWPAGEGHVTFADATTLVIADINGLPPSNLDVVRGRTTGATVTLNADAWGYAKTTDNLGQTHREDWAVSEEFYVTNSSTASSGKRCGKNPLADDIVTLKYIS